MISHWGDSSTPPFRRLLFKRLEDGAKFVEAAPDVHVNSKVVPRIAFAYGCDAVAKRGVIYALDLIANHVSEIIDSFTSEFD